MTTINSTAVAKGLGKLLKAAQREPVTIQQSGQPVAVVMSKAEYDVLQLIKFEKLRADVRAGLEQLDRGEGISAERVFARLEKLSAARRKATARKAS